MSEEDESEMPRTPSFIPPEDVTPLPPVPAKPTSPLLQLDQSSAPPSTAEGTSSIQKTISLPSQAGTSSGTTHSPPSKMRRGTSPQPSTSQEKSTRDRDRELMPPPPIPRPRRPAPPRLTTYEVVTVFAVNSVLFDRDVSHLIEPWKYNSLKQRRPIRTLSSLVHMFAQVDPDYHIILDSYVEYVTQDLADVKRGEEPGRIYLRTLEMTRSLYFSLMIELTGSGRKKIINPTYHWGHLARVIAVTAAIAREMVQMPGRRNLYSHLLNWCVYFFKAWHIDVWLENKGGWEAIVQDNQDMLLTTEFQVVTHPSRESTPSSVSSPTSQTSPTNLSLTSPLSLETDSSPSPAPSIPSQSSPPQSPTY